jgi:predicted metal-dependent HD superfamily phosphohydrolase
MILATRHTGDSWLGDYGLVVDIDLAPLGSEASRFDENSRHIRAEYSFVPEAEYKVRRVEILHGFLRRPRIYQTMPFQRYEAPARANIEREIAGLV